jgi:hypothetical protein
MAPNREGEAVNENDRDSLSGSITGTVADADPHTTDAELGAQGAPMTSDAPAHGGTVTGGKRTRAIVGSEASGAGVTLAQNGWHVIAEGGDDLGPIIRIDPDHIVVHRSGFTTPDELTVPRDLIAEEDEVSMQVFLSVDSRTADEFGTG